MADLSDTICALSTAPGRAGIAVVRVSGAEAHRLLRLVTASPHEGTALQAREATLCRIRDPETGEDLDQALATYFPAPRSYTGEDVAEFSLHGSPVIVARLLCLLCSHGARLAEPGEFTMRAFLLGRMDLTQAEAVRDLIEAQTLFQAQLAARQQSGELSRALQPARRQLVDLIVRLETAVEFVEEDLPVESRESLAGRLSELRTRIDEWIGSFQRGRIIRDGFGLAVVGRPNVGKSSIFNALLERERSIVTEIPGTTRDLVSESTIMAGVPVHLVDTAGVRDSGDRVERLGVDRSFQAMADADAILLVVDGSVGPEPADQELRDRLSQTSCIVVVNKLDLPGHWSDETAAAFSGEWPVVRVSARTGEGIETLRGRIRERVFGEPARVGDGVLVTNVRHLQCLKRTGGHLVRAAGALESGLSEELILFDLREALQEMGAITGETGVEDILGEIFSRFCVGK